MKIALFGGSFNPIQNMHVKLVDSVLEKRIVDQVWVVPCGNHAFKNGLAPAQNRIDMINLALSGRNNVRVENYEVERQGTSYAYDTFTGLGKMYPGREFMFLIGSDILREIERWHEFDKLKKEAKFIIFHRSGYSMPNKGLNVVTTVEDNPSDLSSSMVREYLKQGKPIDGLVNEYVALYIKQTGLYR